MREFSRRKEKYMSKTKGDFFDKIKESTLEMFDENPNTQPQYLPDMMRAMHDVNRKKRTIDEIKWQEELLHTMRFLSITKSNSPIEVWLWGMLTLVDSADDRIRIIGRLRPSFYAFGSQEKCDEFLSICNSIMQINLRVTEFYEKYPRLKQVRRWNEKDKRHCLNDLALILSDSEVHAEDLVSIANCMNEDYTDNPDIEVLARVLCAFDNEKSFVFDNIIDFCDMLLMANENRVLIVEGHTGYAPTEEDTDDIPWQLRNQCFDVYIQKRCKAIEKELNSNNRRLKAANQLECYEYLLDKEKRNIAESLVSIYDEDNLAVIFLNYLELKIAELKGPEPQNSSHQVIINGPVGQVIANVEHMNTTTDK